MVKLTYHRLSHINKMMILLYSTVKLRIKQDFYSSISNVWADGPFLSGGT